LTRNGGHDLLRLSGVVDGSRKGGDGGAWCFDGDPGSIRTKETPIERGLRKYRSQKARLPSGKGAVRKSMKGVEREKEFVMFWARRGVGEPPAPC